MRCDSVGCSTRSWKEVDSYLALLNRSFGCLFDICPERGDVGIGIGGDGNRLDEEFVSTFGIKRRIFLHGLEQDCTN